MKSLFNALSLNRNYTAASLLYLGMTFMLLCVAPEITLYVRANSEQGPVCSHEVERMDESGTYMETIPGCPAGYACCEMTGECVEIEQ
jgi:hypothetical protein